MSKTDIDIDTVLDHYIICALWSSIDDNGEPLDSRFGPDDIAESARAQMRTDVAAFIERAQRERPAVFDGIDAEQIGHDFWLTRNGHGVGFWDRGLGERGEYLTNLTKGYGEVSLYVGDSGEVFAE